MPDIPYAFQGADLSNPAMQRALARTQARQAREAQGNFSGNHGPSNGGSQSGGGHAPPIGGAGDPGGAINGAPAINLFDLGANYAAFHQPAGQNYLTMYYIEEYNALRGDMYFNDLSGGFDAQIRMLREGVFTNELAQAFLQTYSRTLILPPLVTIDNGSTNAIGTLEAMSACYLNDGGTARWVVAAGDTADKCLFTLGQSSGTPTVTAQTYTPSSNIVSLTTGKIATNTEQVIVGRAGAAAQVLTGIDGSPTTTGTMHANTTALWGAIRSPLNSTTPGAETLLLYCNDGLSTLSSTAAIGDAPTAVLTNWPGGGYALGIASLASEGVARAYWVHPLNDISVSMLDSMVPGKIVSTNLEGSDPKEVFTSLPFVKHAMLWRGGIVATDGKQVVYINDGILDLGWNRERNIEGYTATVQCFAVLGQQLLVNTAIVFEDTTFPYNNSEWDEYNPEENTWKYFADACSAPGVLPNIAACTGQSPVYQPHDTIIDEGIFFWYGSIGNIGATFEWNAIPLLPSGINPVWQQGANAWIRYQFAAGGSGYYALTPEYHFFGLPMLVSDIWHGGRFYPAIVGSQTGAKVEIEILSQYSTRMREDDDSTIITQSAVFKMETDWRRNWWTNPAMALEGEPPLSDRLQFKITLTQGSNSSGKTSPNGLPFRVGFYIFLDGKYTSPKTMEPNRYWGPEGL